MKDNLDPIIDPSLRKMLDDLVNELNRTPEGEQKDEIRERIKKVADWLYVKINIDPLP
jgi:hypothetical protein